jgi:alpha-tubulin suppressor-like RCC1 family protein
MAANSVGLSAGGRHTCFLTFDGRVVCQGYNLEGGIGDGTTTNRVVPTLTKGIDETVVAVSADGYHSCRSARRKNRAENVRPTLNAQRSRPPTQELHSHAISHTKSCQSCTVAPKPCPRCQQVPRYLSQVLFLQDELVR